MRPLSQRRRWRFAEQIAIGHNKPSMVAKAMALGGSRDLHDIRSPVAQHIMHRLQPAKPEVVRGAHAKLLMAASTQKSVGNIQCTAEGRDAHLGWCFYR